MRTTSRSAALSAPAHAEEVPREACARLERRQPRSRLHRQPRGDGYRGSLLLRGRHRLGGLRTGAWPCQATLLLGDSRESQSARSSMAPRTHASGMRNDFAAERSGLRYVRRAGCLTVQARSVSKLFRPSAAHDHWRERPASGVLRLATRAPLRRRVSLEEKTRAEVGDADEPELKCFARLPGARVPSTRLSSPHRPARRHPFGGNRSWSSAHHRRPEPIQELPLKRLDAVAQ